MGGGVGNRLSLCPVCSKGGKQLRNVANNNFPDDVQVNIVIVVDYSITHIHDATPGNLWVTAQNFSLGSAGGFTHDFHRPDDCEYRLIVGGEIREAHTRRELLSLLSRIDNIAKVIGVRARDGQTSTNSLIMRSARCGHNPSLVDKWTGTPRVSPNSRSSPKKAKPGGL